MAGFRPTQCATSRGPLEPYIAYFVRPQAPSGSVSRSQIRFPPELVPEIEASTGIGVCRCFDAPDRHRHRQNWDGYSMGSTYFPVL